MVQTQPIMLFRDPKAERTIYITLDLRTAHAIHDVATGFKQWQRIAAAIEKANMHPMI